MAKRRLVIDVSNLSTDPYRWFRTGIQEYNFRTLESFIKLRPQFSDWEIILHPRFRIWGNETNSARILSKVEEAIGLESEEIWGYNLRARGYYLHANFTKKLTRDAQAVHLQSILDVHELVKSGQLTLNRTQLSAVVYDLIPVFFPEYFGGPFGEWYQSSYLRPLGEYARELICISRSTAIDLTDYYRNAAPKSIRYLAIPAELTESKDDISDTEKLEVNKGNYIMAVGSLEPRKNIAALIEGWEIFRQNTAQSTMKLVLVGGTGWLNTDILSRIKNSILANDIVLPGYISDRSLAVLMKQAACVAMISVYEGFGLPVAQAYRLGTPVLTTIGSSLPEACSLSGIFVDPADPWSVAAGIQSAAMQSIGEKQATRPQFSWLKYADAVLRTLCNNAHKANN